MKSAEKRDHKRRRPRISLRALLLCVTLACVVFGLIGRSVQYQIARSRVYATLVEQHAVTERIMDRAASATWLHAHVDPRAMLSERHGGPQFGPADWEEELTTRISLSDIRQDVGISLKMEGGFENLRLRPITIHDHQGLYNNLVIEELEQAYKAKKWAYRIVTERDPLDAAPGDRARKGFDRFVPNSVGRSAPSERGTRGKF